MKKKFLSIAITMMCATATFAQEPPAPPKPPSAEERLKHVGEKLDKELQLSADQKQKVLNAYKDFFAGMEKAKGDNPPPPPPPPPPPVNKEEMDKLVKERDEKIKGVLNDEQFKKFEMMEKNMRPRGPGKHGEHEAPPAKQL